MATGEEKKAWKGKAVFGAVFNPAACCFFFFLQDINDFLIRERPKDISYEDKKL